MSNRLIVRHPRKALAAVGAAARVVWLSLLAYRNPLRAFHACRLLHAAMREWPASGPERAGLITSHPCVRSSGRYFWDFYLPGWPSQAFDRCVERELDRVMPIGRPTALQTAIVAITRQCALRCEHCLEGDATTGADLPADQLHEVVRRVLGRGAAQIFFSGGEPLRRFTDLTALAAVASGSADVWVLTSGMGLTDGRARALKRAGVTGVAISLDHWEAAAHDRFRGAAGVFAAAERAAASARDAGLLLALSLCPTASFVTATNLQRYADTARAFGASFIQILEPRAAGRYARRDVALAQDQQRLLEDFCERLNAAHPSSGLPSVRYLDWSARTFGCCGAADRYVYVDAAGVLHACPFCRSRGIRLLDHDIHSAIARLKAGGCAARQLTSLTLALSLRKRQP